MLEIGKLIKLYEDANYNEITNNEKDLFSINEIIDIYPLLSKHIITNAINKGQLKVSWIGNKRYFKLNDVDNFIKENSDKKTDNIPATIESWRKR